MFSIIFCLIVLVYLLLKYIYSYWSRKGIPYIEPIIPFGNILNVIQQKRSMGLSIFDLYQKSKERVIGIYLFHRPTILVRDPDLVRKVLIEDFYNFHDRGIYCNEKHDPLSVSLFALSGTKWHDLRSKFTPTFTSGKLKGMFSTILEIGDKFDKYIGKFADDENQVTIDFKDEYQRFTIDIVASVFFGIDTNTIGTPDHEFRRVIQSINKPDFEQSARLIGAFMWPSLLKFFRIFMFGPAIRKPMIAMVKDTIEHRENNNVQRKDFMQLMIQLRNSCLDENDSWQIIKTANKKLTIEQCAANILIFYVAGSESTANTMSLCLFELARNPDMMVRLQSEIDDVIQKNNGKITYEAIKDMEYLDLCIKETLRKYPVLPMLNRICTKEYQIPETNFIIEKGIPVIISLLGIHRDPSIFSNPMKFDPERFLPANNPNIEKYYFPFGDGPRMCIASRMGKMVAKVGVAMMLQKYNFEAVDKRELEFSFKTLPLVPKDGVKLIVKRRK